MRAPILTLKRARNLRRKMTLPEVILWRELRRDRFHELRFRRQHPIGPYVADFYCPAAKLVIEVDGRIHDYTVDRDEERDAFLLGLGLRIIRIPASEVLADAMSVADGLVRLCGPSTTNPGPSPG